LTTRYRKEPKPSESAVAVKKPKRKKLLTSAELSEEFFERDLRTASRQYVPSAIDRIAELANSDNESVALRASNSIVDHARKVPKLDLENPHMDDGQIQINIINFEASEHGKQIVAEAPDAITVQRVTRSIGEDVIDVEPTPESEADPLFEIAIKDFSEDDCGR
jgi:hypothetical protein